MSVPPISGRDDATLRERPGVMDVIDLTDAPTESGLRVGMVTRFPPSTSGSASAASDLSGALADRYGVAVDVIRLVSTGDDPALGPPVVMDINPESKVGALRAAERANRCDVALVVLDRHVPLDPVDVFMSQLEVPLVVVADDVDSTETERTMRLARWARRVDTVVVPSETARRRLQSQARDWNAVEVIPHGSPWRASPTRSGERRIILSWGFLTPNLGAHRVVNALSLLRDVDPPPRYRFVGVTDPGSSRERIARYRSQLEKEADRLGVAEQLEFLSLHSRRQLQREIEDSDVIAVVYDSRDRACSRLLNEAVSTGRPVVATAFPGAVEMLATGAGITVSHDDHEDLATALRVYMTDDAAYGRAAGVAAALSPALGWDQIAGRFARLLTRCARDPEVSADASNRYPHQ